MTSEVKLLLVFVIYIFLKMEIYDFRNKSLKRWVRANEDEKFTESTITPLTWGF